MAIKLDLTNTNVEWRWDGEDGEFITGIKPTAAAKARLTKKHRDRKGEVDYINYIIELLARHCTGWGGFIDPDTGSEIPYAPESRMAFFEAVATQGTTLLNEIIDITHNISTADDDVEDADPLG